MYSFSTRLVFNEKEAEKEEEEEELNMKHEKNCADDEKVERKQNKNQFWLSVWDT